jgi:hypothetical protein
MPGVGRRAKTVHASDRAVTVIGETQILQAVNVYFEFLLYIAILNVSLNNFCRYFSLSQD